MDFYGNPIPPAEPLPEFITFGSNEKREAAVADVTIAFHNSIPVLRALTRHRHLDSGESVRPDHPAPQADIYRQPVPPNYPALFRRLERGMHVYAGSPFAERLSKTEQAAALLDVAYVHDFTLLATSRFVIGLAKKYEYRMPLADLVQEGTIGLTAAVRQFNYAKGVPFATFAGRFIKNHIHDAVREQGPPIPLAEREFVAVIKMERVARELIAKLGREPTPAEIAADPQIQWDEAQVTEWMFLANRAKCVSWEVASTMPATSRGPETPSEPLLYDRRQTPDEKAIRGIEAASELHQLIAGAELSDEERFYLGLQKELGPSALPSLTLTLPNGTVLHYDQIVHNKDPRIPNHEWLKIFGNTYDIKPTRISTVAKNAMAKLRASSGAKTASDN